MFQNITDENGQEYQDTLNNNKNTNRIILKKLFSIQDIVLYGIAFMTSMVSFNGSFSPFGLAIFAASCSNKIPARNSIFSVLIRKLYRIWCKWIFTISFNIFNFHSCNFSI